MTVTVKTVSVTYGRKFNLGDYNSATVDCTLWADVSDDQDLDTAMHGLWDMAKANVKEQALPLLTKQTAKIENAFLGLPVELRKMVDNHEGDDGFPVMNDRMPMEFGDS